MTTGGNKQLNYESHTVKYEKAIRTNEKHHRVYLVSQDTNYRRL